MSYKFSMGPTTLSGTLTQVSGTVGLETDGQLSASVKVDTGELNLVSIGSNWTNAGRTVANLGTVSAATSISSTAFVGPIDGIVGGNTPAAGSFTDIVGSSADINGVADIDDTLTLSKASGNGLVVTADADINGAADIAGALTLSKASGNGLVVTADCDLNGAVDIAGALVANGAVTLGDAAGDDITFNGSLLGDLIPKVDSSIDLGTSLLQFAEAHIDTGHIDSVKAATLSGSGNMDVDGTAQFNSAVTVKSTVAFNADAVNIDGGNIDGTIIGASSVAAGSFAAIVGTSADINGVADIDDTLTLSKGSGNGLVVTANADINGSVDIAGDLVLSAGGDGALQFSVASSVKVLDDDSAALVFEEANNAYLSIITKNSKEKVQISQKLALSGAVGGPQTLEFDGLNAIKLAGGNMGLESTGGFEFLANGGSGTSAFISAISGSGALTIDGASQFNNAITVKAAQNIDLGLSADTAFAVAEDMLYFRDATDSKLKTMALASFLTDIAGAGISVVSNQLVADGAAAPNSIGDADATLSEGFNYGSATLTANRTWTLPASPSAGDVVRVKAPASLGGRALLVKPGTGDQIDDQGANVAVEIFSDHGAISLVAISDAAWKIF